MQIDQYATLMASVYVSRGTFEWLWYMRYKALCGELLLEPMSYAMWLECSKRVEERAKFAPPRRSRTLGHTGVTPEATNPPTGPISAPTPD